MKFDERKEFLYDAAVFRRSDTQTALLIHDELVRKHSSHVTPRFFEVDRQNTKMDPLWHMPLDPRPQFSRQLDIPAINYFDKPVWSKTAVGRSPKRADKFWLSNLSLQRTNYFPEQGDYVFWQGYRYQIIEVALDPKAYWHQTNIWLGMYVTCAIIPEGDAKPLKDLSKPDLSETGGKILSEA